ncbi:hypothetical protein [Halobaculum litoreum]|uniref:Transcriptional regulator n=1 Tax=Halobaculum litoreum TaxID=3031998 RepID=A0ABD5XRM2_9EURY|nr:hypothetical protein [Halobaculum sp. DT92]
MRDEWFGLLADGFRRDVLFELLRRGATASTPVPERSVAASDADRLRLRHVDLPKLAAAGVVDWDERTATVAWGPSFEEFRPLLEAVRAADDPERRRA